MNVKEPTNTIYYVYLKYCKLCQAQKEIFRRVSALYPDIEFIDIDLYDQEDEAKEFDPELIYPFFKYGDITYDKFMKKAELIEFIEKGREV